MLIVFVFVVFNFVFVILLFYFVWVRFDNFEQYNLETSHQSQYLSVGKEREKRKKKFEVRLVPRSPL